jgi:hypothetical protein
MVKYLNKKQHEGRAVTITTPSLYGSHASMVVRELDNGRVVCRDDIGEYETSKDRLDSGLTDSNRTSSLRI